MMTNNIESAKALYQAMPSNAGMESIFTIVEHITGFNKDKLTEQNRDPEAVLARALYIYIARRDGHSYPGIGEKIERDHTTVLYQFRKHEKNPLFEQIYSKMRDVDRGRISQPKV